jgi:phosphate:Na+ symporter
MADVWQYIDLWKFLAGLGIFLFGMRFMEESLHNIAGAAFKRFLRKQTNTRIKAILSGTLVTAVLQSSSVVTLMVLAFVGAGVITLQNALGIIVGANLGTTFTGWIVTLLGFKFNIESFALPLIAIGGISIAFLSNSEKIKQLGRFIIGFGFLFLGLDYMKSAIEYLAQNVDLSQFVDYGTWMFFLVGFVLTAIIQSSSASMVINLSALSTGIIPVEAAIAMAIGSDLGTTITALLGSIGSGPATKRAAFSHFTFNIITAIIGLAMLKPIVYFITQILSVTDPLYTLVSFHSLFNLLGIIVVFPFLKLFATLLERMFKGNEASAAHYIPNVTTAVPDAAIAALKKELDGLLQHIFKYNLSVFRLNKELYGFEANKSNGFFNSNKGAGEYETIKQLEGEIVAYYLKLQNEKLEGEEPKQLEAYIFAVRNAMQAIKGIKDISHNIVTIERSANDQQMALLALLQSLLGNFYFELHRVFKSDVEAGKMELLSDLTKQNQSVYQKFLDEIYNLTRKDAISQLETSTMLNVNREVYNANKALVLAIKDTVLPPEEARSFSRLQEYA